MAEFEHKPGRGTIWRNTEDDAKAAWSGKVKLPSGQMAFLDLYPATDRETGELKKDRNDQPFYNVSIKEMTR